MEYQLKNVKTGKAAIYKSTVSIQEEGDLVIFRFYAENTQFYCPYENYNGIHSWGDACEILIGTDPKRRTYYEMEISANGRLMLAKMTIIKKRLFDAPKLKIDFVDEKDCFIKGKVEKVENGYFAQISFNKKDIFTGKGNIYFNAYRLETDGGEKNKHLFALNPTKRKYFHRPKRFVWLKEYILQEK